MTQRPSASLVVCAALVFVVSSALGGCQEEGFECGQVIPGTSTVRRCDRMLEICVCATGSCAKRVPKPGEAEAAEGKECSLGGSGGEGGAGGDGSEPPCATEDTCKTGYRYVEAPFARKDLAGRCVTPLDMQFTPVVPSEEAPGPACQGVEVPETTSTTQAASTSSTETLSSSASVSSTGVVSSSASASTGSETATSGSGGSGGDSSGTTGIAGESGAGGQQ